ncbi:MAG: thymidine phosphorylase [Rhodobacteraceae bacterium]|nr:thymidine phosphorylase [Paracoccaceae bacterium]
MNVGSLIERVRKKKYITETDMLEFGSMISSPIVSDAQIGAFAMAVCLNGLSLEARVGLTKGMRDSGDQLVWDLPGPVLDKHSTGGVGDPVSLLLAPALAACGAFVPMISGRGLGYTGGTLDKLESIPGYSSDISKERFQRIVKKTGLAIVGASDDVAPADQRLYRIRDVTATVDSLDLITASILSKKLSAGLDSLVLDVKTGSGAVIKEFEKSELLARSLIGVANGAGCPTVALLTDMSQPLANAAGNSLEVKSVMETLSGMQVNDRLLEVTVELGSELINLNNPSQSLEDSRCLLKGSISSGRAMEYFSRMVFEMGGPKSFESDWAKYLPKSPVVKEIRANKAGYIDRIDTEALGQVVLNLGGGRKLESDKVDPSVGLSDLIKIGTKVDLKTPIAILHASNEQDVIRVEAIVRGAFSISYNFKPEPILIHRLDSK